MTDQFVEVTSTDNQKIYIRKELVAALEVVTPSARVEGHIKLYAGGFKFLVQGEVEGLIRDLSQTSK
jgi:hypothetical protein